MWKTLGSEFGSTHLKSTVGSGKSGHLCVEDTVIDSRVDDKNVMDSFLSERPWVYHVEVGSQLQPEKLDRISVTDCKHSRRLSMQEGAVLYFQVEDDECHGFLPDGSWKPYATKKSNRILTDCKHSRITIGAGKRTIKI